jgi:hypothetical protein
MKNFGKHAISNTTRSIQIGITELLRQIENRKVIYDTFLHNGFLNNGANHDANGMPLVGSARGIIWSGDAISRRKKPKK